MPKDDINYKFTENGIVYDFYDVFVPAENFRQPALWTWGVATSGALGTNDITPDRGTPVTTFAGGTNWKSVSGGNFYTAAIKTDGTLWTWGLNTFGVLGINNSATRSTPVTTFAGGTNWKSLECGNEHMAAIKTDGSLWVWGINSSSGTLGINDSANFGSRGTPVTTFAGGTNWKQVSCGTNHTAAIKTDGSLWVWGGNANGQLGTNNTTSRSTPVTTFSGGTDWKSVSCATGRFLGSYTAAIKTDGTLWVWGRGNDGQLGTNDTTTRSTPVTTFSGGTNWKQVSCGDYHVGAVKTDGTLWTWGANESGPLGINVFGIATGRTTPVTTFAGGTNWKQVSAGGGGQQSFMAATKTDGTLWTWGVGIYIPTTTFAGGNNWKSASAGGGFHTAAIKYSPDP
jgi:alpha-tubulin suppressor-like RCC1 family protein